MKWLAFTVLFFSPVAQAHELSGRVRCALAASIHYQVPANMLLALAEKEGGKEGQGVRNKNGT